MQRSKRFLNISVLLAVLNVSIFGGLYVDAEHSYFGAAHQLTPYGAAFSFVGFTLTIAAVFGFLQAAPWARALSLMIVTGFVAAFVPMMWHDPMHSLPVLGWQLYAFVRLYLSDALAPKHNILRKKPAPDSDFLEAHRSSSGFAVLITVAIDGFQLTNHLFGVALCAVAHGVGLLFFFPTFINTRKRAPRLFYTLVALLILSIALSFAQPQWGIGFAALFQVLSLYASNRQHPMVLNFLDFFLRIPAAFVTLSFTVIIALGAMFLTFPASTIAGYISPMDALFTSVSAVCVTGLVVLDTATEFTMFGQVVLLVLMQLGGLGIMTLSTVGARMIVGNIGLLAESTFGTLLDVRGARSVYKLVRVILVSTIVIEAFGALCLTLIFRQDGLGWQEATWKGIFHAVSAFCNAGFALQSDSLVSYVSNHLLQLVIMILIIAGGLGFPTMVMILDYLRAKQRTRMPVQARIVIYASLALIVSGWVGFAALEWHGVLRQFSLPDKIMGSLFQSVTLRSGGFNLVPIENLRGATLAFMIIFMFIGGAPGGTAGGIKVTTLTVLLAAVPSYGYGEGTVTIGGRHISASTMYRAISVVVVTLIVVLILHFGLLLAAKQPFEALAFEAVSAVGTVGLSTGITSQLGFWGKALLIFGMFAGRLGPLTLTLAIAGKQQKRYRLATEPVMVG